MELTKEQLQEKINSGEKFLVDFYADWCGPCKVLGPRIEKLAETLKNQNSDVGVYKFNLESDRDYAMSLGIKSIPTVMSFSNGNVVLTKVGILPDLTLETMAGEL
jgi:thioredoxin 1